MEWLLGAHRHGQVGGKRGELSMNVCHEGVSAPAAELFDDIFLDSGLVKRHCSPNSKRVGAEVVKWEARVGETKDVGIIADGGVDGGSTVVLLVMFTRIYTSSCL